VKKELAEVRERVLTARRMGDASAEGDIVNSWQERLDQFLQEDPELAGDLRQLLDNHLFPVLSRSEQTQVGRISLQARASGHARIYQAACWAYSC
jgi:hypothetical protein